MKVVLFCGGLGMRLRDYAQNTPKPLANIGYRPILWHLMNYYAHYGHRDFLLCLGYQADQIKNYFLNYKETLSNDFVLSKGGREVTLLNRDIEDWTISFVDTGLHASIGERLCAVRRTSRARTCSSRTTVTDCRTCPWTPTCRASSPPTRSPASCRCDRARGST